MRKIETLFLRKHEITGEPPSKETMLVEPVVRVGCEWVLMGEGVATEKFDGTACAVIGGQLYRRLESKENPPKGWIHWSLDPAQGSGHGWFPVGEGPEDKWHRQAWDAMSGYAAATYELVGPKVQGNPYCLGSHELWRHGSKVLPLTVTPLVDGFGAILQFLATHQIEGIVWHHPDGRMVKIKRRDFGLIWPVQRPRPKVSDAALDAMLSPPTEVRE